MYFASDLFVWKGQTDIFYRVARYQYR